MIPLGTTIPAGKYSVSLFNAKTINSSDSYIQFRYDDDTFNGTGSQYTGATYLNITNSTQTIDIQYPTSQLDVRFSENVTFDGDFVLTPMLVYGDNPSTTYEPYTKEEIPLDIELKEYDYIDVENDLIRRQTSDTLVLDGSDDEIWALSLINSNGVANFSYAFSSNNKSLKYNDGNVGSIINAQIPFVTEPQTSATTFPAILSNKRNFYLRLNASEVSTVTALRTWLASNPIQFVYKTENYTDEPYKANQLLMATTNNTLALYNKYDIIKKENIKHDYGLMFEDNAVKNLVEAETIEISTSGTTEINLDELPIIDFVKVYAGKHFNKIEKTDPIIFSFKRVGGGMFGIPGMVFGLPTFSVIYELLRRWTNERLKRKQQMKKKAEQI